MRKTSLHLIWIGTILGAMGCSDGNEGVQFSTLITHRNMSPKPAVVPRELHPSDCIDFAVLMSASKLAMKLNKSRTWVKENYQIPIYVDTLEVNRRIIGESPPGSHCLIIKQENNWFYVQSSTESKLGWIHRDHVVGFVKKDPETFLPCSN